jgi:outer membrane protein TolC
MMKRFVLLLTVAVFLLMTVVPAWAEETAQPAAPSLSLNDAIKRALTYSESVKKAAKQVDLSENQRDQVEDTYDYIPTENATDTAGEQAFASLISANLTWQISEKSLTAQQDSITMDTCNSYWGIQLKAGDVEVAKQSLKQAELDLNKARAYYQVGLLAKDSLLAAETKQVSAKYTLEKAQNDLDTAYESFNQLVGLSLETRPLLTDEPVFALMEETNLDYLVTKVLENSPTVWAAEQKVELQESLKTMMFYTGEYTPYESRSIQVDQAVLDAASAREATEILTRNLYYTVLSLEQSYPAAEQAVKLAEENLRVAQVKYDVGMLTKADVTALETALVQAKQNLLTLKKNHAYYKLVLDKPWAA